MVARICVAAARAAVLGGVIGVVIALVGGMLGSFLDLGDTLFVAAFYAGGPIGAAAGAWAAAIRSPPGRVSAWKAAAAAGAFVSSIEAAIVVLGWWLESLSPAGGNPWVAPTALLALVLPAALLSTVGAVLSRFSKTEHPAPRPPAGQTVGLMVVGAVAGLGLGFLGAMSVGMMYAESLGSCSISAIAHAFLGLVIGPLVGIWMGRWAAISFLSPDT